MSYTYPCYSCVEKTYEGLKRKGLFDYSYIKTFEHNENKLLIYYYWSDCGGLFKIVYDNYEGVFNKKDFMCLSTHESAWSENTICISNVLKSIKLKEKTDKQVTLKYDGILKNNDPINFEFTLNFVDFNYVRNVTKDVIELNEKIKCSYNCAIKSCEEILNESDNDDSGWGF